MNWTQDAESYVNSHYDEALALLMELARIPAPSHHEEKRAAFIADWLNANGFEGVRIDEAKNVIIPLGDVENKPLAVFMAHTDVVFPDTEPLPIVFEDGKVKGPGSGDDTANVVSLLMALKYIKERGIVPQKWGILCAANSCEEGLGNLKGSRQIVETYGSRIQQFFTFDGSAERVLDRSVGSKRFRVRIKTEGGHSYGAFGNRNAIEYMAGMIQELYHIKVPEGGKSTYNVGTICGGTSVNSIAQEAEMTLDFRSDIRENLDLIVKHFYAVAECYRAKGVDVEVEVIGDRPCMGDVDAQALEAIIRRGEEAVERHYGFVPGRGASSTDCNIPLSLGIPSTRVGTIICGGAHTREEWVDASTLGKGVSVALDLLLGYMD